MTAHTAITDPPSATPGSSLATTIALRELRAGAGGLVVFVLCIALGVAAVAAIGSLAAAFDKALANQGRVLIGGDLSFEVVHRQATKEESAALYDLGQVSQSASFRAMARGEDGKSALVEVKAVDEAYPLYGEVNVIEPLGLGPAWRLCAGRADRGHECGDRGGVRGNYSRAACQFMDHGVDTHGRCRK